MPAARHCAVSRVRTVGTAAAVSAKTGEYNPYAVEKYPIPVPPSKFISGILKSAPTIFVIAIDANKIIVFFMYFLSDINICPFR